MNKTLRCWLLFGATAAGFAFILKLVLGISVVNTAIVISGWVFIGHLVIIDDDFVGGWSNPFGTEEFPWTELFLKGLVFVGVLALKFAFGLR